MPLPLNLKPCSACTSAKVKCDRLTPCSRCTARTIPCQYLAAEGGRMRRHHKRSTGGCVGCKRRHVRCDEGRPGCLNCESRGDQCIYPEPIKMTTGLRARTRSSSPIHHHSIPNPNLTTTFPTLYTRINPTPSQTPIQESQTLPSQPYPSVSSGESWFPPTPSSLLDPQIPHWTHPQPDGAQRSEGMNMNGDLGSNAFGGDVLDTQLDSGLGFFAVEQGWGGLGAGEGGLDVLGGGSQVQVQSQSQSQSQSQEQEQEQELADPNSAPEILEMGMEEDTQEVNGVLPLVLPTQWNGFSLNPNTNLHLPINPTSSSSLIHPNSLIHPSSLTPYLKPNQLDSLPPVSGYRVNPLFFQAQGQGVGMGARGGGKGADGFSSVMHGLGMRLGAGMGMGTGIKSGPTSGIGLGMDMGKIRVDEVEPFFPGIEARLHFKHFCSLTCEVILTIPTPSHRNPWLTEIVPLALTHPHGTSLTADALRLSILSFAAFDIGFRMARRTAPDTDAHHSAMGTGTGFSTEGEDIIELKTRGERRRVEQDNAMYELSRVQRRRALELLDVARIAGQFGVGKEEGVEMDLALATALILSIRDRLAGALDWNEPMDLAIQLIHQAGGPQVFLSKRISRERKFIIEQMICVEIIACLTILTPTKLLTRDHLWFTSSPQADETGHDHVELVYGMDRDTLAYICESLYLSNIKRDVETLRVRAGELKGHLEIQTILVQREAEMQAFGQGLLDQVVVLRNATLMTPHATRVVVGNLLFQAFMELWITAELVEDPATSPKVQRAVDTIFEIVTEAMTRGMYSGFLLPCSWAATFCTTPDSRIRCNRIIALLRPGYHLDYDLTARMIHTIWYKLSVNGKGFTNCGPPSGNSLLLRRRAQDGAAAGVELNGGEGEGREGTGQLMLYVDWERFMKDEGLYVPIF